MITLTPEAIKFVKKNLEKKGGGAFRVSAVPSGCSNLSYKVDIVEQVPAEDLSFPQAEVIVCTDPKSHAFLKGMVIDYRKEGLSGKYHFINPNETGSCGCGKSFSVNIENEEKK